MTRAGKCCFCHHDIHGAVCGSGDWRFEYEGGIPVRAHWQFCACEARPTEPRGDRITLADHLAYVDSFADSGVVR